MTNTERVEGELRAVQRFNGGAIVHFTAKGQPDRPQSVRLECSYECGSHIGSFPIGTLLSFQPGAPSSPLDNLTIDGQVIEFH